MKTIAVLVPSFTIEYTESILSGIYDYFNGKDVKVIIAQTKFPHSTIGAFDYQYWTSVEFLKAQDVDGYIFLSGVFASSMSHDELEDLISSLAPRPVVSIGVEFNLPGVYTIKADCKKSFFDIVGHLKNVHNRKKIAFLSANKTNSAEAIERYDAFTEALEHYGLTFYPELVMDGYFTNHGAEAAINAIYKTKADVDFDALVCANDMMASGAIIALHKMGVKVPEDVVVTGFDDAVISKVTKPSLSTINQDIHGQGWRASEVIDNLLNDQIYSKEILIPLISKYRQSCGCIECGNSNSVYYNSNMELVNDDFDAAGNISQYFYDMNEKNNIITLIDTVKGSNTLKQFFFNFKFIADQTDMSMVAINFFKEVWYLDADDEYKLPEEAVLHMLIDRENNSEVFKPGGAFHLRNQIINSRAVKEKSGIFILHPIFSGESNYGYVICKIKNKKFADYIVHLKIIISSIAQSYEYTAKIMETQKLESEKTDLTLQSITDELTQILNRRGFIDKGQSALDVMQETDRSGVIFFADMDGLKTINDTYGHEMGDKAIRLQAQVLKSVFRESDVVGRLSGDEFGVVAVGMKMNHVENVRLKIELMNKKISMENDLPFNLSISLGAVDLQKSSVLKKLLAEADKQLYNEKRKKRHARLSERT